MQSGQEQGAIVLDPGTAVTAAVIWLHGLGADGHDFEAIVPELGIADELGIRFIFPHAPYRPITLNNGYVMRGWYDIVAINKTAPQDEAGIRESEAIVQQLIRQQLDQGVPAARIVLAGFSQGGAIVLHTALRFEQRLAGVMALSTYLPLADILAQEAHDANQGLPVFMGHGTMDEVVPASMGEATRDRLIASTYPVEWHSYPMPHSVCPDEIRDITVWLKKVLA